MGRWLGVRAVRGLRRVTFKYFVFSPTSCLHSSINGKHGNSWHDGLVLTVWSNYHNGGRDVAFGLKEIVTRPSE
jgi:hypothetical protein